MRKSLMCALMAVSYLGTSAGAYALTMDEMKKPGSAVSWYQDDADMKELDVADYLFNTHAKKEVTDTKIKQVGQCVNQEMADHYANAEVNDADAPSLLSLLKKCKA